MFGKSSCSDKCFGGHCRGGLGWDFVSLVVDLSFFYWRWDREKLEGGVQWRLVYL